MNLQMRTEQNRTAGSQSQLLVGSGGCTTQNSPEKIVDGKTKHNTNNMKTKNCSCFARGGNAASFGWLDIVTLALFVVAVVVPVCLWSTSVASASEQQHGGSIGETNRQLNVNSTPAPTTADTSEGENEGEEYPEETEPVVAVLFPAFSLTVGVMVFYVLSRKAHILPYTGVMFLVGTLMGIGVELHTTEDNQLHDSTLQWISINSNVLFLTFLPGLIFKDSFCQNAHLFYLALNQCLMYAFPLVLAGTTLTALIAYYIFPFGWSFNLAMTFGSILSATDPVAVAALMEEIGGPPRLKVHINGEALLNDGSAIVFYSIFSARYFYELNDLGLGEPVDLKRGIAIFCRKSLGAVASGIFFGVGLLLMLYLFQRRFSRVENVVEVTATIAIAYTGYYVAEIVWGFSGIISTFVTGVMLSFFGLPMVSDPKLLDDFWVLVEHLLNTGVVWGDVIAKGEKNSSFRAQEWGYLLLLYVLLTLIRLALFVVAYPISSRIGLKTNWRETLFQVHAGLRGAVGIALAIALDNTVRANATEDDYENIYVEQTQKAFAFVGGIAFLTLSINGVTAGPALRKLGLADSTETREKIVTAYQARFKAHLIEEMVRLLSQQRFSSVNFAFVKHHVPYLRDMTRSQLMKAVQKHRDTTKAGHYHPPSLKGILPYLPAADGAGDVDDQEKHEFDPSPRIRQKSQSLNSMRAMMEASGDVLSLQELRLLFISILRSSYKYQISSGELEDRQILAIALSTSLDFAEDSIHNGSILNDWDHLQTFYLSLTSIGQKLKEKFKKSKVADCMFGKHARTNLNDNTKRLLIERSLSFMAAHSWAKLFIQKEFADEDCELTEFGQQVILESQAEYNKAHEVLDGFDPKEVSLVVSHRFCLILLNSAISYIAKIVKYGVLKDQEAEHLTVEIQEQIHDTLFCETTSHPGELERSITSTA